jgi:hypothetical protein
MKEGVDEDNCSWHPVYLAFAATAAVSQTMLAIMAWSISWAFFFSGWTNGTKMLHIYVMPSRMQ